jgi:hypothetical protein
MWPDATEDNLNTLFLNLAPAEIPTPSILASHFRHATPGPRALRLPRKRQAAWSRRRLGSHWAFGPSLGGRRDDSHAVSRGATMAQKTRIWIQPLTVIAVTFIRTAQAE